RPIAPPRGFERARPPGKPDRHRRLELSRRPLARGLPATHPRARARSRISPAPARSHWEITLTINHNPMKTNIMNSAHRKSTDVVFGYSRNMTVAISQPHGLYSHGESDKFHSTYAALLQYG